MYSNGYIFRYASIMVILVAAVLSAAAILLQPAQERNVKIEKIQDILKSANIESTPANAEELYAKYIVKEIVINAGGEEVGIYANGSFEKGDRRAFDIDLKSELKAKSDLAQGKAAAQPVFPLFVAQKDNEEIYIIPLRGVGLWGPIWGNIALKSDLNTIEGVTFGHKGETPGLGAEIATPIFTVQFPSKTIFDENGTFTSIIVVKGGVANSNLDPAHGVDAISGGTITSNGVSDMLKTNLENYVPFIQKHKAI
ncbi:MAG: NADH:ubiquinone reductase (Na(+)-transporting) subunit C [Lentimicrobium sp.]|jgi:Na+-transporting NADH:ubiquinone oxidoreductase subunit C|nr:NADH:ubiquinone reductase (Na(+)-transporting) subunit C [Lentimicrobium sp.]